MTCTSRRGFAGPFVLLLACLAWSTGLVAGDWPNWRGPNLDGVSVEQGLPERWSPEGENLAWQAPYGARSAPVVAGNRVYLQNTSGRSTNWTQADDVQERVMAFDAETGDVLWEHRFSIGLSDVPPNRVGWASPTVDPETGVVYAFGVAGRLLALSPEGALLWERLMVEEFGLVTTHGGRTVTPLVEGDLVIVNGPMSGWGPWARGINRYFAFDKRTGEAVWISSPQVRHYDTNYAMPVPATVDGQRLLIVGGTDGTIHALRATTGEPVWEWEVSKRAINTSVVVDGTAVIVTHSEENPGSNRMGMVAVIDPRATGAIGPEQVKWQTLGWHTGFSSPVVNQGRIYAMDNFGVLGAFDVQTGERLWTHVLGTIQKASLVMGDGKLYVGTENGKFFILRPREDGVDVLSENQLGTEEDPEQIIGSVAIAHGRVYLASERALYAIGEGASSTTGRAAAGAIADRLEGEGPAATVQITPLTSLIAPGESRDLSVARFDARGRPLPPPAAGEVEWSLEGLEGRVSRDGTFTAAVDAGGHAGAVTATVGPLRGAAQVRVVPPLPWREDFEAFTSEAPPSHWINATGKFVVTEIDGVRALRRLEDTTVSRRARVFMGPATLANYTVEVDVRSVEQRRQLGDVGIFAQRYGLILFGNRQRLELHPWQTAVAMTVGAPYEWQADTWYRLKLRVQNLDAGTTRVQGKVWPRDEPEPPEWLVEKVDTIPHRKGSPGLYADAPFGAYFDNLVVTPNGT